MQRHVVRCVDLCCRFGVERRKARILKLCKRSQPGGATEHSHTHSAGGEGRPAAQRRPRLKDTHQSLLPPRGACLLAARPGCLGTRPRCAHAVPKLLHFTAHEHLSGRSDAPPLFLAILVSSCARKQRITVLKLTECIAHSSARRSLVWSLAGESQLGYASLIRQHDHCLSLIHI